MNTYIWGIFTVCILLLAKSESFVRKKRIVGGKVSAEPSEKDPTIYIYGEDNDAQIYGVREPKKGFFAFRGLRYGEPPVGQSRFQRPSLVRPEGEINATKWGSPCPQPSENNKIIGDEDCLYLNIFTPALPSTTDDGYPVLLWIHGGGFRRGSASQYEMSNLIRKHMIVVSIQYRLGTLGFLSTGSKEFPGNNALFDMMLASNWIKNYIHYFGGDPNKVIPFGHGTGAISATLLTLSKFTRDYFSGLIAMSGSVLSNFAVDKDPMNTTKIIAAENGCPINNTLQMVRCLKELPVEKIIATDSKLEGQKSAAEGFISGLANLLSPGPVVEGSDDERALPNFVTDTPENFFALGDIPGIPLLTGVVKDEAGGAIFGKYKDEVSTKLKEGVDFVNKQLLGTLQSAIPQIGKQTRNIIPEDFGKYLNVFGEGSGVSSIAGVGKAIGDAIFNVPALLTVQNWSKKAKAFLYSFDHKGKRNFGKDFLSGLPIVDAKTATNDTNHGDDLGYIFGRNSILGQEIPEKETDKDEEDERVTDIFTEIIANFATNGNFSIPSAESNRLGKLVPDFSDKSDSFVSITSSPQVSSDFRYCEMGLWIGLSERTQSAKCSLLKAISQVDKLPGTLTKTVESAVPNLPGKSITEESKKQFDAALPKSPIKVPSLPSNPFGFG